MDVRFRPGSRPAHQTSVSFGGRENFVNCRVEDLTGERASALITITAEPIRSHNDPTEAPSEVEADLYLEWGLVGFGGAHEAIVDIGQGITFSLVASELRLSVRNTDTRTENQLRREWRVSAFLGGAGQQYAPVRALRVPILARDAESANFLLPKFAYQMRWVRAPQAEGLARFINGAGLVLGEFTFPEFEDPSYRVPVGADRVTITNRSGLELDVSRLEFELAL